MDEDKGGRALEDLHLPELRRLAQERGIDGEAQMHKAELVEALRGPGGGARTAPAAPAPEQGGEEMIRSEERLRVGAETREAGTVRLEKQVVSEPVTAAVELERDEVEVVREPIPEADRDALGGRELGEATHEVTLREQVPVVEKEVVPTERVRVETRTAREQVEVSDELRHERIDVGGPDEPEER